MKCGNLPAGAMTEFMQSILKRPTAANYDNVIATSSFYTEDDDDKKPEEPVSCHYESEHSRGIACMMWDGIWRMMLVEFDMLVNGCRC